MRCLTDDLRDSQPQELSVGKVGTRSPVTIGILRGEGIGPDVVDSLLMVLQVCRDQL